MTGPPPATVSVCVATYRRPAQLAALLRHLAAQSPPAGGYEVVVVDDGSPPADGVAEVLSAAGNGDYPVPLRWVSLPQNRGPATARNRAWREASGDWIAFTDDDCRPGPEWLARLIEAGEEPDPSDGRRPDVVQGLTRPDPDREALLAHPLARSLRVESWSGLYQTANIAYRRSVLEAADGFYDGFPHASGEDTDLGWRAAAAGAKTTFAPQAVVFHDVVVRRFGQDWRDRRRWGDLALVVRRHPGVRVLAWRPYILRRSHVVPLLVLAGAPLLLFRPTRPVYLGALALAGARAAVRKPEPAALAASAQARLGDLYEVLVLVRASLRHRTVLL